MSSKIRNCWNESVVFRNGINRRLLNGMITKHAFWISHSADLQIDLSDPDNVPSFSRMALGLKIQEGDWVFKIWRNNSFELTLKIQPVPAAKRFAVACRNPANGSANIKILAVPFRSYS